MIVLLVIASLVVRYLMTAVIPQGVRHLKGCSVFSIQYSVFFAIVTLFVVTDYK